MRRHKNVNYNVTSVHNLAGHIAFGTSKTAKVKHTHLEVSGEQHFVRAVGRLQELCIRLGRNPEESERHPALSWEFRFAFGIHLHEDIQDNYMKPSGAYMEAPKNTS